MIEFSSSSGILVAFSSSSISGISDSKTKICDQILTESTRLQFHDFITVILLFRLTYMYHSFNSMVKRR